MSTKNNTDIRATILFLIEMDNNVTLSALSEALGINQSAVQRHIECLKDSEMLKREGGRAIGKWKVIKSQ